MNLWYVISSLILGAALLAFSPARAVPPVFWYPPPMPVAPSANPDNQGTVPYSDREIRRNVENQFFGDSLVNAFDVDVDVRNGVVTLTGTVRNREDRRRAEMNAYEAGAKRVVNRLKVKP